MQIIINGKSEVIDKENITVFELLKLKNVEMPEMVSVELNGKILARDTFSTTTVKNGDKVEFLYFMGGGSVLSEEKEWGFETRSVHCGFSQDKLTGATSLPIYETASYAYPSAQDLADVFDGKKFGYIYTRISNPTITAFEQRINALENGLGAVATSSGMSAITTAIYALVKQDEEIIVSKSLFGGTFLLLNEIFEEYGVKINYVDATDVSSYKEAINDKSRLIFLETLGNPKLDVPDIQAIAAVAKKANIPLIADSTLSTPYLFNAKKFGVDIVIHSTTKYITGNGTSIGGVLIDLGNFDWGKSKSEKVKELTGKIGEFAFLYRVRREILQNTGCCLSPFNAFIQNLGLETLSLRMEKHCDSAMKLASMLKKIRHVFDVNYPGLPDNPHHEIARKLFNERFGGLLTFKLKSREQCFSFIDNLKIAKNLANLGDAKTLVIHPASTIYHECSENEMLEAGVTDNLIRVSVGIEDPKDIIADFKQALNKSNSL